MLSAQKILKVARDSAAGLAFAIAISLFAMAIADLFRIWFWGTFIQGLSSVSVALVLGIWASSFVQNHPRLYPGLKWCSNILLKFAVVLVGLRMSLIDVSRIGISGLPVVAVAITCSLALCALLARFLRVESKLAMLVGFGTSICGVSAIMAAGSINGAKEKEITYAICLITIFGFMSLFISPIVANFLFSGSEWSAGMLIGSAVHDTAQVAGAALFYEQFYHAVSVLDVAVVTKMIRNMSLIILIPVSVFYLKARQERTGHSEAQGVRAGPLMPPFIIGFILLSAVRTVGDLNEDYAFGFLRANTWWLILEKCDLAANVFVTIATAAIGANSNFSQVRKMGWRPLFLGLSAAIATGASAAVILYVMNPQ